MSDIVATILAGGLGTRLRSVVNDRPKVLATVLGKPFLAYLLDQVVDAGIGRAVLLTGYRGEQVQEQFGDVYRGMELDYSAEPEPLGTAGALRLALPKLFPDHDTSRHTAALVMNGDSYCGANLEDFCALHEQHVGRASLVLTRVSDASRFGRVEIAPDGRIERFLEKREGAGAAWINAGIYLIGRDLIAEVPERRSVSIERDMFPAWSQRGALCGFRAEGEFLDIGTPESYQSAAHFFASRARMTRAPAGRVA